MQLEPDYSCRALRLADIRKQYAESLGLRDATGPGWYLTNGDTALIVPNLPDRDYGLSDLVARTYDDTALFDLYVWNSNASSVLVMYGHAVGIRSDMRSS